MRGGLQEGWHSEQRLRRPVTEALQGAARGGSGSAGAGSTWSEVGDAAAPQGSEDAGGRGGAEPGRRRRARGSSRREGCSTGAARGASRSRGAQARVGHGGCERRGRCCGDPAVGSGSGRCLCTGRVGERAIARRIGQDPVELPRRRRLGQRELDLTPWTSEPRLAGGCGLEAVDDVPIDGAWDTPLAEPRGLGRLTAPWIHSAQVADLRIELYASPIPDPPAGPWSACEQFASGAVDGGTSPGVRRGRRAPLTSRAART